jgi:hypothetical protein
MLFASFDVARDGALDDRANYISWLSALFHPLLDEILFDRDASWVVKGVVRTNNLKEAAVTFSLLISGDDTVYRGFMLPETRETKNNCHSNSLQRFQEK